MRSRVLWFSVLATILAFLSAPTPAAEPAAKPSAAPPVLILDTSSFWRMFPCLKPPVAQLAAGLKPGLTGVKWFDWETPGPPADWAKTDFDDTSWSRMPLRRQAATPYLAQLYLRGKFRVTDPAKVRNLNLSLEYIGGVIVYVNGKEIKRADLPAGPNHLAAPYPPETFCDAKGGLLDYRDSVTDPETKRRKALRWRKLDSLAIPAGDLKSGVNVLAVEVVRSPYDQVVQNFKPMGTEKARHPWDLPWGTCQARQVRLTAESNDGVVSNYARPAGFQVWNSDTLNTDFDLDYGDPCDTLRPIALVGLRNGAYSGKVAVGSDQPIVALKAVVSDLKGDGSAIPASAVRLRYGLPWGEPVEPWAEESPGMDSWAAGGYPYGATARPLAALAEAPLAEFPVVDHPVDSQWTNNAHLPAPVFGAVTSVWATVKVPADAKPGLYRGQLTLTAKGQKPVQVPLEINVAAWTLPDTQNYRTWSEFMQSPETLAMEYHLEPWSPRHWQMIAHSFQYFGETSSRMIYVPLIAHTNLGNEYSMVRWIKKPDGKYDWDFSIMDKYLDTAVKNMGPLKNVCFVTWEIYLIKKEIESGEDARAYFEARKKIGNAPVVTVLDRATGKLDNVSLSCLTDPGSRELWKPLFDQLRAHLKARGLESAATIGFLSDAEPTKEEFKFLDEVTGGMPWTSHSHHGTHAPAPYKTAYYTHVFSAEYPLDTSRLGWLKAEPGRNLYRRGGWNAVATSAWRAFPEIAITGTEHGLGRLGGDYWPVLKDKKGRRSVNAANLFPESNWRNLELITYFLAPGPDGPIATTRFDALREGLQDCEVRIYLEAALADPAQRKKLGDELAGRIQQTLDDRIRDTYVGNSGYQITYANYSWGYPVAIGFGNNSGHAWFLSSRWQDRSARLYALAAEVEKLLPAK